MKLDTENSSCGASRYYALITACSACSQRKSTGIAHRIHRHCACSHVSSPTYEKTLIISPPSVHFLIQPWFRGPPTCSHASVLCSLPFQATLWSHYAFSWFLQCNRSFQPCARRCSMLLCCLEPPTAKGWGSLGFFVFVVILKTLEVVDGGAEGWGP